MQTIVPQITIQAYSPPIHSQPSHTYRQERISVDTATPAKSKTAIGALIAIVLGVAVVAGVGFTLHTVSAAPQPSLYATKVGTIVAADGKTYNHYTIADGVYADPINSKAHGTSATSDGGHPSWPSYGPSTDFVLPANSYITMTLTVYDGGEKLNTPYFGSVVGTVDGTVSYDGVSKSSLPFNAVEHTFTLHGLPTSTQDPLFVNVPLPVNTDAEMKAYDNDPTKLPIGHKVTFSFITKGAGHYVWNCEYPCGDSTYQGFGAVMGQLGYMSGKVTVA